MEFPNRQAIGLVDLGSRWNGMARAYVNRYHKAGVPTYMLQLVLESPRMEWAMDNMVMHIKEMVLDGKVSVPG